MSVNPMFEVTLFAKSNGCLTKRISLESGSLKSDGSACVMSTGTARRFGFSDVGELAVHIERLGSNEALALGRLRPDLPDQVKVTTKRKLNGDANFIARTQEYILYPPGKPTLALVDFDTKGIPPSVAAKIAELGGCWPALVSVLPALANAARIERKSTSAGLYRDDTREKLPGSDGAHVYLAVSDGSDSERFLKALHARCWLAGLGWMMLGAGGQLLERSIVDRIVGSPERLVFEGPPLLVPPLEQDRSSRRAIATRGEVLDTATACPPLTILEQSKLQQLQAREAERLAPVAAKAKKTFIERQAEQLTIRTGISLHHAKRVIERQCAGILLPSLVLPFDDEDLAGATVADVLADPARFEGTTLADPLEGVEYGTGKAMIMLQADGAPWIHSFAHGRTVYKLKLDYRAAETLLNRATPGEVSDLFVRCAIEGDLGEDGVERLRNLASAIAGVGKRSLDAMLKSARQEDARLQAEEQRNRRLAERRDPRPQIPRPELDAEWLPQMQVCNDVLGCAGGLEPPARNIDKFVAQVRSQRVLSLHFLTNHEVNDDA
jgi:hypothetical protein